MRKITTKELQEMKNSSLWNEEEFKKWLEENKIQPVIWGHAVSYGHLLGLEEDTIPLEQDENGTYGYKVLIRIPESPWFWSPNRFRYSEWIDNRIICRPYSPEHHPHYGIYATKSLEALKEWYRAYHKQEESMWGMAECFAVRIRAWGIVVEHTKGFRAEYAEIDRILFHGEWQNGHW